MKNLKAALSDARANHYAIPAFNIFDYPSAWAVIQAGEAFHRPVILQTSVGTVLHYGAEKLKDQLTGLMEGAKTNVYLHLDHCSNIELAKVCVDCGWDSIMFDGSALSFEENIRLTHEAVMYAHEKGVCVEGELGTIEGVEEEVNVETGQQVGLEESLIFIEKSGIDFFAPAVGTAHGLYKGVPKINFKLLEELADRTETPIVIHGGTGLSDETFQKLVTCQAAKINISTALKCAYFQAVREFMEKAPHNQSPLALEKQCMAEISQVARHMFETFQV